MSIPKRAGAFAIDRYGSSTLEDLDNRVVNARDFLQRLHDLFGTEIAFEHYNHDAFAVNIEHQGRGSGSGVMQKNGNDLEFAETVDMLYFSGHGNKDKIYFHSHQLPTPKDSKSAGYQEIQLGDANVLKWLVLDACNTLNRSEDPLTYCEGGPDLNLYNDHNERNWQACFRGLRYILGFDTFCHDYVDRGWHFATFLQTETIHEAWRQACVETEDDENIRCAYLRPDPDPADDSSLPFDRWTDDIGPETVIAGMAAREEMPTADLPFVHFSSPCGTDPVACPA